MISLCLCGNPGFVFAFREIQGLLVGESRLIQEPNWRKEVKKPLYWTTDITGVLMTTNTWSPFASIKRKIALGITCVPGRKYMCWARGCYCERESMKKFLYCCWIFFFLLLFCLFSEKQGMRKATAKLRICSRHSNDSPAHTIPQCHGSATFPALRSVLTDPSWANQTILPRNLRTETETHSEEKKRGLSHLMVMC